MSRLPHPMPFRRVRLFVELLESREMLDAGLSGVPESLLIQYRHADAGILTVVPLAEGKSLDAALAELRSDPNVLYAEPDFPLYASVIPNDESFSLLYGLHNTGQSGGRVDADIDAPEAWALTTGSMTNVVAVIDSGVDYAHPDLYLNIWINQNEIPATRRSNLTDIDGDGIITFRDLNNPQNQGVGKITDQDGNGRIDGTDLLQPYNSNGTGGWADGVDGGNNGYRDDLVGWDFANNDNNPFDDNGHGTHVAGTIGAIGNNVLGVTGVNWSVQLMPVKFLSGSGSGSTSAAVSSVNYAVNNGANVSNNSWGGGGYSTSLYNAIATGQTRNHVFVAAAGNESASSASYPALYNLDNILSVAATDRYDNLASYSNRNATNVDLGAPGSSIRSTYPGGGYATLSGTSMATPHVAGVVALVRTLRPEWTYNQLITQVLNSVDPLASLAGKTLTGGRLNASSAISNLGPIIDVTGPRVLSASPNSGAALSSIRITFSEAINPSTLPGNVSLTGPAGSIATSISPVGLGNTQFDILFQGQTTPGIYTLEIAPAVLDSQGNAMDQNQDGSNGTAQDRYTATFTLSPSSTFSNSNGINIPDRRSVTSSITVNQDLSIEDLNVQLNISHTYVGDLYIRLRGPDGTTVVLFNRSGGSGDNLTNTIFSDEATAPIASGAAPFSGTYQPVGLLSAFDGKNARGTWQLFVADQARYDTGRLNNWSITFGSGAAGLSEGGGESGGGEGAAVGASASAATSAAAADGVTDAESLQVEGTSETPLTADYSVILPPDGRPVQPSSRTDVVVSESEEGADVGVVRISGTTARRTVEEVFTRGRAARRQATRSLADLLADLAGGIN